MASLRPAFTQIRRRCQPSAPQWQQLGQMLQGLQISSTISSKIRNTSSLTTTHTSNSNLLMTTDRFASAIVDPESFEEEEDDEFDEDSDIEEEIEYNIDLPSHARAIPVSPSYFSRQPEFNDSILQLLKLVRKYSHYPTVPGEQRARVAFRTLKDYRLTVGENIKASQYAQCMTLVKRLHMIHPQLQSQDILDAMENFKRDINPYLHKAKEIPIDKFGRALGVGRRKTSTARAWVVEGTGEVLVNSKSLADAFGRIHDRESAVWALKATERVGKYNVWALVEGGGTTGQAEAVAMAIGRALLTHEPALKPALRRAGVLTRDPRGVERKKHGHLKARKKPAWVKR